MYLVDENNNIVNAEFSFGLADSEHCIIVESSGGSNQNRGIKRRNPEYNKLLTIIFTRLRLSGIQISRIVLDSEKVTDLPVSERIAKLDTPYPIDLNTIDIEEFRKMVGRKIAAMHRQPDAMNSGNNQKRIRICLAKPITAQQLVADPDKALTTDNFSDVLPHEIGTEREYLRAARCGQGKFREALLQRYSAQCPVTGITNPDLLIASHIKPWNACTNVERLDPQNGILLSAMIDKLFDKGLITFSTMGRILVSPRLSFTDIRLCGLDKAFQIILSEKNSQYMAYHREIEFKKD